MTANGETSGDLPAMPTEAAPIENVTFDEIVVGQSASIARQLTVMDVELFATVSGNIDPVHLDAKFAADSRFQKVIGHGMWSGALISGVLGTRLPGAGTVYAGQDLRFRRPVGLGDVITATVTVREVNAAKNRIILDTVCTVAGKTVIEGECLMMPPVRPAA